MQPGVADGLADDDPIAGPIRRRPVERLEDHFGTVQAPELVLRFPGQGVQLDALGGDPRPRDRPADLASGRRRAEIAALNVEDVDFDRPGFLLNYDR